MTQSNDRQGDKRARTRHMVDRLEARRLLATVYWDGGAGTSLWRDSANWSTDLLPTSADDVVIDVPSQTIGVIVSGGLYEVKSVTSQENLGISSALLSIREASTVNGQFSIGSSGGELTGAGSLTINGSFDWRNGALTGIGSFIVGSGATVSISPWSTTQILEIARPFENHGIMSWLKAGTVHIRNGGLVNHGVIRHTSSGDPAPTQKYTHGTGSNPIINHGTIEALSSSIVQFGVPVENAATGTMRVTSGSMSIQHSLINRGQVLSEPLTDFYLKASATYEPGSTLQAKGRLRFEAGTHLIDAPAFVPAGSVYTTGTSNVTFNVAPALMPDLRGTTTFNVPITFPTGQTIGGNATFHAPVTFGSSTSTNGTIRFNSTTSTQISTFQAVSGSVHFTQPDPLTITTLSVSSALSTVGEVHITTSLNWTAGTITGLGPVVLESTATGTLDSNNSPITLDRTLINHGLVRHLTAADLVVSANGRFENRGIYESRSATTQASVSGSGQLVNYGTIRTVFNSWLDVFTPVVNHGGIVVGPEKAELRLLTSIQNIGSISVGTSGTLHIVNPVFVPGSTTTGTGTIRVGGNATLEAATFDSTMFVEFWEGQVTVNRPLTLGKPGEIYYNRGSVTFNAPVVFRDDVLNYGSMTFNAVPTFADQLTVDGYGFPSALVANVNILIRALELGDMSVVEGVGEIHVDGWVNARQTTLRGSGLKRFGSFSIYETGQLTLTGTLQCDILSLPKGSRTFLSNGTLIADDFVTLTVASGTTRISSSGGSNRFTSNGVLRKWGLGTFAIDVPFQNNGTVFVDEGTLLLNGGLGDRDGNVLSGTWDVSVGASLRFVQAIAENAGTILIRGGSGLIGFDGLQANSGTIELQSAANWTLTPPVSTGFTNRGTLRIGAGSTFNFSGNLRLDGAGAIISEVSDLMNAGVGRLIVTGTLDLESGSGSPTLATPVRAGTNPLPAVPVLFITAGQVLGAWDSYTAGTTSEGRSTIVGRTSSGFSVGILDGPATSLPVPTVQSVTFDAESREAVILSFNTDVGPFLSRKDVVLEDLATSLPINIGSLEYDAANHRATLLLTNLLPNGNYRFCLRHAEVANAAGTPMTEAASLDFFILRGDVNRDRAVNFDDLLLLAQNYGSGAATLSSGDVNYDGTVDFNDLLVLAQNYGQDLVVPSAADARVARRPFRR